MPEIVRESRSSTSERMTEESLMCSRCRMALPSPEICSSAGEEMASSVAVISPETSRMSPSFARRTMSSSSS